MPRTALLVLALGFAGCGTVANHAPAGQHIGQPVAAHPTHRLAEVQAAPQDYFNQTLLVEATVVAVCKSKGCWMQVEDGGQKAMVRWETGCGGKFAFPADAVGERVLIQGSFYPKEISPEDLEHLQGEAADGVTFLAKGYEMNASAVVLTERTGA